MRGIVNGTDAIKEYRKGTQLDKDYVPINAYEDMTKTLLVSEFELPFTGMCVFPGKLPFIATFSI